MAIAFEIFLFADLFFQTGQLGGVKLEDAVTFEAAQVAMMLPAIDPFVMHVAVLQIDLGQKP
jgi:hypothetical protein